MLLASGCGNPPYRVTRVGPCAACIVLHAVLLVIAVLLLCCCSAAAWCCALVTLQIYRTVGANKTHARASARPKVCFASRPPPPPNVGHLAHSHPARNVLTFHPSQAARLLDLALADAGTQMLGEEAAAGAAAGAEEALVARYGQCSQEVMRQLARAAVARSQEFIV